MTTQRQVPLVQPSPFDGVATKAIDTAHVLSNYNHRLYRQQYVYNVKLNIAVDDPNTYLVFCLKDTWMTRNAYKKAYEAYLNNTKEERAVLGKNMIARWEDFRVEIGYPTIQPADGIGLLANPAGEILPSEVTDEAGNQYTFSFNDGASAGTKLHIMAEYDKMGNVQKSPEGPASSVAYGGLDDDVNFAQASDLQQRGDEPPYDADQVQATNLRYVRTLSASGNNAQLSTGFFMAPAGLIVVQGMAANSQPFVLEVSSGKYKGVMAEKMV